MRGRPCRRSAHRSRSAAAALCACRGRQDGAVTAELAIGLLPLAVVLLLAAWLAAAGTAHVRVQLAAGAAARALARGEEPTVVAGRVAGASPGAVMSARRDGEVVRVEVVAPLDAPVLGRVGAMTGSAVAPVELLDGEDG